MPSEKEIWNEGLSSEQRMPSWQSSDSKMATSGRAGSYEHRLVLKKSEIPMGTMMDGLMEKAKDKKMGLVIW